MFQSLFFWKSVLNILNKHGYNMMQAKFQSLFFWKSVLNKCESLFLSDLNECFNPCFFGSRF